ncbi:uncharacterized protein LOC105847330 isoform X12 [Hydra vulgaris]|uniref:uncharacterized protein LOC105847330 isoform X12 n=1 Tax=Hydra vulgaris TaxID=6087 RepID=UPI0032EA6335
MELMKKKVKAGRKANLRTHCIVFIFLSLKTLVGASIKEGPVKSSKMPEFSKTMPKLLLSHSKLTEPIGPAKMSKMPDFSKSMPKVMPSQTKFVPLNSKPTEPIGPAKVSKMPDFSKSMPKIMPSQTKFISFNSKPTEPIGPSKVIHSAILKSSEPTGPGKSIKLSVFDKVCIYFARWNTIVIWLAG